VHENIDALGLGNNVLDGSLHGRLVADVHLDQLDAGNGLRRVDVAYRSEDDAALLGKPLGRGAPDAGGDAGDYLERPWKSA
jgi:hypothetical protein